MSHKRVLSQIIALTLVLLSLIACDTPQPTLTPQATPTSAPIPTPEPTFPELSTGWTKIEPGGDTRCAHDTPYAFWARPGTMNRLLIYLQGSGMCADATGCMQYDGTVDVKNSPDMLDGIFNFDMPDNPFKDHYFVYIPDCTGDFHIGNNIETYTVKDGSDFSIYHKGFVNASAALDWVYEHFSAPESIFVTGCSSGALGSIIHTPYVIEHYPDSVVSQLGDSSPGLIPQPIDLDSHWKAQKNFPQWIPSFVNLKFGESQGFEWYNALANYYSDHTFSQYNTTRDIVLLDYFRLMGGKASDFSDALETSLSKIHTQSPNFRSFTISDNRHCVLHTLQFYITETGGIHLRDWVAELAEGGSVDNVQDDDVNVDTGR